MFSKKVRSFLLHPWKPLTPIVFLILGEVTLNFLFDPSKEYKGRFWEFVSFISGYYGRQEVSPFVAFISSPLVIIGFCIFVGWFLARAFVFSEPTKPESVPFDVYEDLQKKSVSSTERLGREIGRVNMQLELTLQDFHLKVKEHESLSNQHSSLSDFVEKIQKLNKELIQNQNILIESYYSRVFTMSLIAAYSSREEVSEYELQKTAGIDQIPITSMESDFFVSKRNGKYLVVLIANINNAGAEVYHSFVPNISNEIMEDILNASNAATNNPHLIVSWKDI